MAKDEQRFSRNQRGRLPDERHRRRTAGVNEQPRGTQHKTVCDWQEELSLCQHPPRGPRPAPSFIPSSKQPKRQAWTPTITLYTPSPRPPIFERLAKTIKFPNSHLPISNNKCRYHLTAHRFDGYSPPGRKPVKFTFT